MKASVVVVTVAIFAWFLFMLYETTNMTPPILPGYPGDSFFPRLVLIFGLICAATILIKAMLAPRGAQLAAGEAPTFSLHWLEFLTVCALVTAYGVLLVPVGFEIMTFVLMLALLGPRMAALSDHPRSLARLRFSIVAGDDALRLCRIRAAAAHPAAAPLPAPLHLLLTRAAGNHGLLSC